MDIWDDGIREWFSAKFKPMGVKKCYFPLFITKGALEREADHVEGFAAEASLPCILVLFAICVSLFLFISNKAKGSSRGMWRASLLRQVSLSKYVSQSFINDCLHTNPKR